MSEGVAKVGAMRWLIFGIFWVGTVAAEDGAVERYLGEPKRSAISKVVVETERIRVWGVGSGEPGDVLFEWPASVDYIDGFDGDGANVRVAAALTQKDLGESKEEPFAIEVPRFIGEGEQRFDRAMTRWGVGRLVDPTTSPEPGEMARVHFDSEARWADRVVSRTTTPHPPLRSRKGLGAIGMDRPLEDLDALGVTAVTFNILVDTVIRTEPGEGRTAFDAFGRRWYADEGALAGIDRTLQEAAKRKLLVSAILLLRQANQCADREWGKMAAHPDAHPDGIFVMPNLTDESGVAAYGAALELLAERYSRPEVTEGSAVPRIHHWILHNEVNSGWVWTNAGMRSALSYVDLLHRSARLTHCIAKRYDSQSQVFVSLDHHWTTRHNEHCFGAREILDRFLQWGKVEGDFDWAIAHHPYPQDLFEPRVWRDDQVTFDFDTPKITFRNLEVLDAWVQRPEARFDGKVRKIHLSEQGLNSRTYLEPDLINQAAGMAYAWKRMESLPSIELFHYHNWVDNRHEGGLRIGLRRFPDDEQLPGGTKPIWDVFRQLGTESEAAAIAFAMERIGREAWDNPRVRGKE